MANFLSLPQHRPRLGVKYQLGVVDPGASLVYRFALSAVIMVAICVVTGRSLRFNRRQEWRWFWPATRWC